MKTKIIFGILLLINVSFSAQAREMADVSFAETVSINGVEQPLKLNGLGIRYKFFFKIYIAALYVTKTSHDAVDIIKSDSPKRMVMHFLYDEIPQEKLVNGWNEGFEDNLSDAERGVLQADIKQFNAMFETIKAGEVVTLDYLPAQGTVVTIKGVQKGVIKGAAFYRALLKIWIGEEPVTEELKEALLDED